MKTVLALFLISILKLSSCFNIALARRDEDYPGVATEFPFAQAKVKYHRSRYCITAFGETNCVRMNEEPGNASKIAKLYKIMMQEYTKSSALRTGKTDEPETLHKLSQQLDQNKLSQFVKAHELIHNKRLKKLGLRTNPKKLSQFIKPIGLSQKQHKLRQNIKTKKMSKFVKPRKMNEEVYVSEPIKPANQNDIPEVSKEFKPNVRVAGQKARVAVKLNKLITQKPKWHVAPIPRRSRE